MDKRAESARGWKRDRTISLEDFAYATSKGQMFDAVDIAHDIGIREIVTARDSMSTDMQNSSPSRVTTILLTLNCFARKLPP